MRGHTGSQTRHMQHAHHSSRPLPSSLHVDCSLQSGTAEMCPTKGTCVTPASLRLSVMKTRLPVLLLYTWSAKALLGALLSLLVQEATTAGCGGMVHACHPGTQKVEAGSSEVQGKPVLHKILSQTKTNRKRANKSCTTLSLF